MSIFWARVLSFRPEGSLNCTQLNSFKSFWLNMTKSMAASKLAFSFCLPHPQSAFLGTYRKLGNLKETYLTTIWNEEPVKCPRLRNVSHGNCPKLAEIHIHEDTFVWSIGHRKSQSISTAYFVHSQLHTCQLSFYWHT